MSGCRQLLKHFIPPFNTRTSSSAVVSPAPSRFSCLRSVRPDFRITAVSCPLPSIGLARMTLETSSAASVQGPILCGTSPLSLPRVGATCNVVGATCNVGTPLGLTAAAAAAAAEAVATRIENTFYISNIDITAFAAADVVAGAAVDIPSAGVVCGSSAGGAVDAALAVLRGRGAAFKGGEEGAAARRPRQNHPSAAHLAPGNGVAALSASKRPKRIAVAALSATTRSTPAADRSRASRAA